MEEMDKFPAITKNITLEEALLLVRDYLLKVGSLFQQTPGGPFEPGGISWSVPDPGKFGHTIFGDCLIRGLFGRLEILISIEVSPAGPGGAYIPGILIKTASGKEAIIQVREGGLICHEILTENKCGTGKIG